MEGFVYLHSSVEKFAGIVIFSLRNKPYIVFVSSTKTDKKQVDIDVLLITNFSCQSCHDVTIASDYFYVRWKRRILHTLVRLLKNAWLQIFCVITVEPPADWSKMADVPRNRMKNPNSKRFGNTVVYCMAGLELTIWLVNPKSVQRRMDLPKAILTSNSVTIKS